MLENHDETELVALQSSSRAIPEASRGVPSRAIALVEEFYEELRDRHLSEEAGRSGPSNQPHGLGFSPVSSDLETGLSCSSQSPRRNRRRLYTNEEDRNAAFAASLSHLELHKDWLYGSSALSADELRACIALQHYVSVDVEDLSLPPDLRRMDDEFADSGVCQQFLLDAGRSEFLLPGRRLSFRAEVEASGLSLEADALAIERMLRDFETRLVAALLECLGDGVPKLLVQAISRAMSQSGMANLEKASQAPQIVVSGGEQSLSYELVRISGRSWAVNASMRKYNFEQFVVVGEASLNDPGQVQVMDCHTTSQIVRSSNIVFEALPIADRGSGVTLSVDVRGLVDRVELLDPRLRPIQLARRTGGSDGQGGGSRNNDEESAWRAIVGRRLLLLATCWRGPFQTYARGLASRAVSQCRLCRRRARGAVDSAVQLPRRMVSGVEEGDDSMRTPLRD